MLEFIVTIAIFIALVIPVGNYLYHISTGQKTFADPVMDRIDGVIYKISGVRPEMCIIDRFDLVASDESIRYYSPDAEISENGEGEVIVMFNYTTTEEKQWFDSITDVDLVAFNENNNTLNNELRYTVEPVSYTPLNFIYRISTGGSYEF